MHSSSLTLLSIAQPWLWIAFIIGILLLLLVDLSLFKRTHKASATEQTSIQAAKHSAAKFSLIESAAWITISLAFNLWLGFHYGFDAGIQFLTGYLIEKSLSVDNLFVILLIFSAFRIPAKYQHRVLFFGVLGAIIMRGIFIIVGAHLLHMFHWVFYVFGVILVLTAGKFAIESFSEAKHEAKENWAVRFVKRMIPVTSHITSDRFFVLEAGRRMATPLLLALVVIELTDLIFAVDSIPAVFSVTNDAFIAFASNILALLGLRALYFVLAESVSKFRYLKPGLAAVLGFIGAKMLIADFFPISSFASLGVIALILAIAGGASAWADRSLHPR